MNKIIGKHFHSFTEKNEIKWQGRILDNPETGYYLVQLYSWIDGRETDQLLINFEDMLNWKFYETDEEMNNAYYKK